MEIATGMMIRRPHVQDQLKKMQENHALRNLMLLKNSEPFAVDSAKQDSMKSEVEHSWTFLYHLLAFLLCLHHPCLSFLFLFLSSINIRTHP